MSRLQSAVLDYQFVKSKWCQTQETSNDIPIMILDGGIKILKVNNAFLNLFEITDPPISGSHIWELDHSF